jgi:hypothetical protein|tara:strand:- start:1418 stop:1966 length:549 start_codon:yes stop_codon:yes gene_type:complete
MSMDSGDTAWMLMSCGLVNLMTPGLAFFYGGLVRQQNVLTMIMQNYVSMGLMTICWIAWGYSMCFGENKTSYIWGNPASHAMLSGIENDDGNYGAIPGTVFAGECPPPASLYRARNPLSGRQCPITPFHTRPAGFRAFSVAVAAARTRQPGVPQPEILHVVQGRAGGTRDERQKNRLIATEF